MKTLSTVLHTYRFDLKKAEDIRAYDDMLATIERETGGARCWTMQRPLNYCKEAARLDSFMSDMHAADGQLIVMDTSHLFNNQWNVSGKEGAPTARNKRVFPWAECVFPNRDIREGYWFAVTDEMRAILRDTVACGYCAHQEPAALGNKFCPSCYGSEYLKPADLKLTRLLPVAESFGAKREELTDAERAELMPRYLAAQIHGETERQKARIAKAKEDIEKEYVRTCADALEKRDAARWILAHLPGVYSNWIFYSHTGRHCFGWRAPLSADVVSLLLEHVSEFPFNYDIKCDDGRTLSN